MERAKHAVIVGGATLLLSLILNFGSSGLLEFLPLTFSFVLLFLIIFVGIVFDIIGMAAASGDEDPFHAMASNRIVGAKQAIWLVRHADQVASFCSDVVGDIAGTLSGAIGAAIVFRIILVNPSLNETLMTTLVVALVAAFTVGGKAYTKNFGIASSTEILYAVGRILFALERVGLDLTFSGKNKDGKKRNPRNQK